MVHRNPRQSLEAFLRQPRFAQRIRRARLIRLIPILALVVTIPLAFVNPLAALILFLAAAYYFSLFDTHADLTTNRMRRVGRVLSVGLNGGLAPSVLHRLEQGAADYDRALEELKSVSAFDPGLEPAFRPLLEEMMLDLVCGAMVGLRGQPISMAADDADEGSQLACRLIGESAFRIRHWSLIQGALPRGVDEGLRLRLQAAMRQRGEALKELGVEGDSGAGPQALKVHLI